MKAVGRVALKQALRQLGLSYRRIAAITGVHPWTAWLHVAARPGSNVSPWGARTKSERREALAYARELLADADC